MALQQIRLNSQSQGQISLSQVSDGWKQESVQDVSAVSSVTFSSLTRTAHYKVVYQFHLTGGNSALYFRFTGLTSAVYDYSYTGVSLTQAAENSGAASQTEGVLTSAGYPIRGSGDTGGCIGEFTLRYDTFTTNRAFVMGHSCYLNSAGAGANYQTGLWVHNGSQLPDSIVMLVSGATMTGKFQLFRYY